MINRHGKRRPRDEKKTLKKNRERKLNEFEIAFQNIEFDGREISASEPAEALETSAKELLSWLGRRQASEEGIAE